MNKTALKVFKIILHVVGWPLLAALVLILNINVIKGGSMYGVAVFVCLIVALVMAGIFYLTYFLVRTKKKRSIRNQHVIVAIVAICCLCGFWALLDAFIPGPLETATSSTLRWEDLSDNWGARAEVQEQLLSDYVTINYTLGRLTAPNGEEIKDYIQQGPNGNEELHNLLEQDFHSIDSNGYSSFKGPSIDYAQDDRMTIPVLLHLFLDDRSAVQDKNSDYAKENGLDAVTMAVPYYDVYEIDGTEPVAQDVRIYHGYSGAVGTFYVTDQNLVVDDTYTADKIAVVSIANGKWTLVYKEVDLNEHKHGKTVKEEVATFATRAAAVAAAKAKEVDYYFYGSYRQASVNWHVLDMLGTAMEMSILNDSVMQIDLVATVESLGLGSIGDGVVEALGKVEVQTVTDLLQLDLVPDAMLMVADMVAERDVLGSPIYISLDSTTGMLTLSPSNTHRGVLGYMEMGWLYNQGLLYIIVSLFSTRTLFYAYAPFMALIAILLGLIREKELQLADSGAPEVKKEKKKKEKKAKEEAPAPAELEMDDLIEDESPEAAGSDIVDFDV